MESKDIPAISLSTESTHIEITPILEQQMAVPEPPKRSPMTEVRRLAPVAPAPAASVPQDPRKASEFRKPVPAPLPVASVSRNDEDPEKLLREYADCQKAKLARLEAQLVDVRKTSVERDAFKAKVDQQAAELQQLRAKLDAAGKADAVIKDLQAKLAAAILSNSMGVEENGKLRTEVQKYSGSVKQLEESAAQAERRLADSMKNAAAQQEARRDAESRIAVALQALGGAPAAERPSTPAKPETPAVLPTPSRVAQPRPGLYRR